MVYAASVLGGLFLMGAINAFGIAFIGSRSPLRLGFSLHRFFTDWERYGDEVWFSTMGVERQGRMRERYPGRFPEPKEPK
jgi:hypothetical protein